MPKKTRLAAIAAALVVAVALVACGDSGDDTSPTATETVTTQEEGAAGEEAAGGETEAPSAAGGGSLERSVKVRIADFAYDPDPVQVAVGGKVIWQNEDAAPHTATADDGSFDTGPLDEGKLKSETFKEPGTVTYFCEIHPTMHGTLEVIED